MNQNEGQLGQIIEIKIEDIIPNRFQPREIFDEKALSELSQSIKEHGVIQPILVRKIGDKYEIIAGERRYKASVMAGKMTIPAILKNLDDGESSKVALLENLQRKDLTPIELARTYQNILKVNNMTQDQLAKSLGVAQSTIANKMRLLNLTEEVQDALLTEKISERHARSLLNVDQQKQNELLSKIMNDRMTVRDLDNEIAKLNGQGQNVGIAPFASPNQILQPSIQNDLPNSINFIEPNLGQNQEKSSIIDIPLPNSNQNNFSDIETLEMPNVVPEPIVFPKSDAIENIAPVIDNSINEVSQPDSYTAPITPVITPQATKPFEYETSPSGNIYDLRFAINNIRQAVQTTEKFGFVINTEEFDFENMYQIIIKIDKNK